MSEQNTSQAGQATPVDAAQALLGTMLSEPAPAAPAPAEAAVEASAPQQAVETPPAEPEQEAKEPPLSELIRQQRAERQARVAREKEAHDLQARVQELEGRLSKLSKADMLADPIGFAEAHGFSEQEMAIIGQAYLYHLVPDKAPPDLRYKMLEARTARERKQAEAQREQEARAQAEQQAAQQIQQYTATLGAAVQTWETAGAQHPYPASQAWFGGSHEDYSDSLVHTARNIAEVARGRGEVADLSPKAVAAALERDLASRMARFRPPAAAPTQQSRQVEPAKTEPTGGKQPAVVSTRGQGGSPEPKATTDEERLRRAARMLGWPDD